MPNKKHPIKQPVTNHLIYNDNNLSVALQLKTLFMVLMDTKIKPSLAYQ